MKKKTTAVEIKEQLAERLNVGTVMIQINPDPYFGWCAQISERDPVSRRVLQQLADFHSRELRKQFELVAARQLN